MISRSASDGEKRNVTRRVELCLLQRLFMNLCAHRTTRSALLRQLLLILKGAATAPSATVSSTSAADGDAAMADVRAATDEEEEDQRLFGCQAHVVYARGSGVPPLVLRRVLEVRERPSTCDSHFTRQAFSL
jgi:hypothetical protein